MRSKEIKWCFSPISVHLFEQDNLKNRQGDQLIFLIRSVSRAYPETKVILRHEVVHRCHILGFVGTNSDIQRIKNGGDEQQNTDNHIGLQRRKGKLFKKHQRHFDFSLVTILGHNLKEIKFACEGKKPYKRSGQDQSTLQQRIQPREQHEW